MEFIVGVVVGFSAATWAWGKWGHVLKGDL